ncbi:hypothetical protein F4703DRAFT_1850738, partial [Phycomyces blakesleeanus]
MTQAAASLPSVRYMAIACWIAVAESFQELPETLLPGHPMSRRVWSLSTCPISCSPAGKWPMFSKEMLFPVSQGLSACAC